MKTKSLILALICLFIFAYCKSPADPEIEKVVNLEPIETIEEEDLSLTAIEIVDTEVFYTCADIDPEGYVREKLEFRLTIKNVTDETISGCVLTVKGYGENSQGEWDYLLYYQWDMLTGIGFMPRDILPGEMRIISTIGTHPLYLGTQDENRCVILRDKGSTEFSFKASF